MYVVGALAIIMPNLYEEADMLLFATRGTD